MPWPPYLVPFFGVFILKESIHSQKIIGLFVGTLGVVIMSYSKALPSTSMAYLSILACLGAAACYGFSGSIIKKYAKDIPTKSLAGASQILLVPPFYPGFLQVPFKAVSQSTSSYWSLHLGFYAVV